MCVRANYFSSMCLQDCFAEYYRVTCIQLVYSFYAISSRIMAAVERFGAVRKADNNVMSRRLANKKIQSIEVWSEDSE